MSMETEVRFAFRRRRGEAVHLTVSKTRQISEADTLPGAFDRWVGLEPGSGWLVNLGRDGWMAGMADGLGWLTRPMRYSLTSLCIAVFCLVSALRADDWPQWLGPERDSVWRESGIVERFPARGLKVKWRVPVSLGYAGPAVSGGRVFVTDYVKRAGSVENSAGGRDKLQGTERVLCLDAKTGNELWKHEYARAYDMSYAGGPRATPAVAGDKVYTLGAEGDLHCLRTTDGHVVWKKNFQEDYGAETPFWGFAAHPLVRDEVLYSLVGGEGSLIVAFDRHSGKELWRALTSFDTGYCPPTLIEHGGVTQLLIWGPQTLHSLDPKTAKEYWSVPLKPDYGMSIAAPRLEGNLLFASGVMSNGVVVELGPKPSDAKIVWRGVPKKSVYPSTATPFVEDGVVYGSDGPSGMFVAARLRDGERLWQTAEPTSGGKRGKRHATAFLVKHRDRFFLFSETGDLILAKLSPLRYEELDRVHVLEPTNSQGRRNVVWSHPAFAQKSVFARNDTEIVCVDLAAR